jgi:hypothetical protein
MMVTMNGGEIMVTKTGSLDKSPGSPLLTMPGDGFHLPVGSTFACWLKSTVY